MGLRIAGRTLNNLRYADNTLLMAVEKEQLKVIIRKLKTGSEKAGMYFNIRKTKTTESWRSFEVDGEEIEVADDFFFLGALVECEGRCEKEIRRRIMLGKVAMQGLEEIWKDKQVSLQIKTRIVNTVIFPVIIIIMSGMASSGRHVCFLSHRILAFFHVFTTLSGFFLETLVCIKRYCRRGDCSQT